MIQTHDPGSRLRLSWLRLMGLAAVTELALLVIVGVALRDGETLAFGVVVGAASAWFLLRPNRIAVAVRSLVFLDVFFFMTPATIANLTNHESFGAILVPLALSLTSGVGMAASATYLLRRNDPRSGANAATGLAVVAVIVFAAGLGATVVTRSGDPQQAVGADLRLNAHSAKFSTTTLTASSGQVAIYATNDDLFWHTFTIEKIGVDVRIPVKGHRRVTFAATPGTYRFYCAIPGHAAIGMQGTLTVR